MSARLRRLFSLLTATATTLGLLLAAPGSAGANGRIRYVALGDSFASGPLIPPRSQEPPLGCLRSDGAYPTLVARSLGVAEFVNATCGGARTKDMAGAQPLLFGSARPQFDALTRDTGLVTVTIGGNDIGYSDIFRTCSTKSILNPLGNPCQRHYDNGGTDQLAERISATSGRVGAVLDGIRERAPHAVVVVVAYLRILPPTGGCWPTMPIARGDVPYLDRVEADLNAMLGRRARAAGAVFVNPGEATGHDVCQTPGQKWVEGLVPTSPAAPVHPNAAGMAHVAGLVVAALRRSADPAA